MQDRPTLSELVESVRLYLEGTALPHLTGHAAFHGKVAVNVLGIVQRELAQGPRNDAAERERLSELLGESGDLQTLNRRLCQRIREGAIDLESPALRDHLRRTAIEKLGIDNPKYASYLRVSR